MFVCAECGASQPVQGHCPADGTPLAPIGDDLLLGTTIGAYRVARLLGVGGMGRVYKGVHPQIGSRVAIKVLSRECSDRRDLVDRFFAEAKAVNLIRHESIVNVLDLSTLPDGRPYIVMEYLDGSPLSSIIDQALRTGTPLPIGGVARLAAEVLDALGAAHVKGIVHRDLKPDNIYVTPAGRPKVLDFGIAKLQPELGGSSTHTGSLLGTPHYMSPEQAAGRPVDHRADLYAIGVILFECVTLQKPFTADSLFDLLGKHVSAPPPSPRAMRRDLPESVEHVIYTALAKHPEHRFASAQAMSMALQHATMQLPADQWAPIAPVSGARSSQGGWAPTPPASWAGGQRPDPRNQSTQTAGQVATSPQRRRSSSKQGLWIAIAALLLVGGGITALVVAGGGATSSSAANGSGSSAGSGAGEVVAAGSGSAVGGDPWGGTPAGSAGSAVSVGSPGSAGSGSAAGSAGSADPRAAMAARGEAADDLEDANDDMVDAIDDMLQDLGPDARAMLPPAIQAALAKYGSWGKIPLAERKKLAAKMVGASGALAANAVADASRAFDTTPPANTPGLGPDGWVVSRRFRPPAGFDPKKVDAQKYLPFALAEAKKLIPDAVLFRIDAEGVFPDGHADFTAVDNGSLDYRFISPSRAKRDPSKPIGAKQEKKCMFRIMIDKEGAWSAPLDGWDCKEALIGVPKCSLVQVWKKALAKKAPPNALAELGYRAWDGRARWYFTIDDDDLKISEVFDDDC